MNYARSAHGLCCLNGIIYAVGGFEGQDENSSLDTGEKFDPEGGSSRWLSIHRCIFRASGCSLAAFAKRYIFKFGGKTDLFTPCNKIEYYDSQHDNWNEVNYNTSSSLESFPIAYNLCSLQINKHDILIFGGLLHNVKCRDAYILHVEKGSSDGNTSEKKF
jgi:hypothetical protein